MACALTKEAIGFIILAGCLGSHLGGCRVIGLGLVAMTNNAVREAD